MLKLLWYPVLILVILTTGAWILFCRYKVKDKTIISRSFTLRVPKDTTLPYKSFTIPDILKRIKYKEKIPITLDDDELSNLKKLDLIKYEARKLKYTLDTMKVLDITLTGDLRYRDFLRLLSIVEDDRHKFYVLLKNGFIIFGEIPHEPTDTAVQIQPIYL